MAQENDVQVVGLLVTINGDEHVLMTASQVGQALGVSRQRVYELMHVHEDFPRPFVVEKNRGLWERRSIDRWAKRWQRAPGRKSQARERLEAIGKDKAASRRWPRGPKGP